MKNLLILDYDNGNASSIKEALKNFNLNIKFSKDKSDLINADFIILPGVGHFESAMDSLKKNDLINILTNKIIHERTPVLGICLGFQLMTIHSEEGNADGLGWINSKTMLIRPANSLIHKVPHIGWRTLNSANSLLLQGVDHQNKTFYFCHKYFVNSCAFGLTDNYTYDSEYVGIYQNKNIFGVQFHPEKSKEQGQKIFKNFLSYS